MIFKAQRFLVARFVLILTLLSGMFGAVPARTVHAATLTVTNTNDSGAGSLRQAIIDAAPGDTINFAPSLAGQTIDLSSQINLEKDLTIDGAGLTPAVEISGSLGLRIFYVTSTVTLKSLLLKEGRDYSGSNGGAIFNDGNLTVTNSTFINNSTTGNGGAIYSRSSLNISNSTFVNNSAFSGGAIYMDGGIFTNPDSSRTILNNTFVSNQANAVNGQGGGIFSYGDGDIYGISKAVILANNTFSGNGAHIGGGLYSWGNLSVTNNIFANSTSGGDCVRDMIGGTVNGSNNLIEDGISCSTGSFVNGDPLLGPLSDNGGPTLTMALLPGSPAIDAGTAVCVSTDQRGVTRPQGAACEIGAYEYEYRSVIHYVKWDANGANNGTSWTEAYTDLQSALAAASSGDEIWVAAGTYKPTAGTDRTVSFNLKSGVTIYGGFAGTETSRTFWGFETNITVLSGDIGVVGDNSDNSYHVVVGSNTNEYARLDGFWITAGNGDGPSSPNDRGGGMYNDKGNPSLTNTLITGNYATFGGGMYNGGESSYPNGSSPDLTNVIIWDNSAIEGGGMRNENYSRPRLMNVSFSGNTAVRSGGGMENFNYGNPIMTNVTFYDNSASAGGGMMNWSNSSPMLVNVTFHANSASEQGGAIYNDNGSRPWMMYVTSSGNQAPQGGGLYNAYGSDPILTSSIFYGNPGGEIYDVSGTRSVGYSIIRGGYTGTGNLDADPLLSPLQYYGGFTQTMALGAGSPAMDAGENAYCPSTDQRGVSRPQGSGCDIGAYEYIAPPTPTPTNIVVVTPTNTPTATPTSAPTNTPTLTPTATSTPISNCNAVYHGPLTLDGGLSMSILNQTGLPLAVQDVFVVWNNDKGHSLGADKTLILQQASLNGTSFWNGNNMGPNFVITPSTNLSIPTGNSTILFTFHQSYDNLDGSEQILINLKTNGCQSYPIDSNTVSVTDTPTPTATFTPTNTATPPYSYNPLLLSLTTGQTIGGVAAADEDILSFDGNNWAMVFDGSDVGVGSPDLFAFSFLDGDSILMSFTANVTVNGITATPQDVLRFDVTSFGSTTTGIWSLYFDGSDVGLGTSSEAIDSLTWLPDGRLLISTTGNPSVTGISGAADEDVLAFTPTTLGANTSGSWAIYFDGSDVGLADSNNEDIDALDVTRNGNIYLSTLGDFAVNGLSGADEDVFVCVPSSIGLTTACNYSPTLYFDGSTWGLSGNDVDAFNFIVFTPPGPSITATPNTPTPTATASPPPTATFTGTPTSTPTKTSTPTATSTPPTSMFVQIVQPNGGEVLNVGTNYRITWNSTSDIDKVTIGYKACDSCLDWIANNIPNVGYYDWTVFVGNTINTQFKIYIIGYDTGVGSISDTSDNNFTVLQPTPTPTNTVMPTATQTPTQTPTRTNTPAATNSPTFTPTTGSGSTLTFAAVADTRVSQASPTTNYGTATTILVDGDSGAAQTGYIRFTANGISGSIQSAKLRVYCTTNGTANGPAAYLADSQWIESGTGGMTWNTQPALLSGGFDNKGAIGMDSWVEYDVTALVTGNNTYTFALVADSSDGITFSSREGTTPPQLVVALGPTSSTPTYTPSPSATFTGTPTATSVASPTNTGTATATTIASITPTSTSTFTPTPTSTPTSTPTLTTSSLTFLPVEDAYIASGSPTTNYGSATTLQVDNSPIKHFLIKFNVSGLNGQQVTSAKLRFYNVDPASKGGDFYAVSDTSWQEETITWNNAPVALTNLLASLGSVSANNWYEIDITSLIAGDGTYSLRISSTSSDGADYSSKEGVNPPELVITVH